MGRARRVRQGGAPRMAQQPRQFGGQIDRWSRTWSPPRRAARAEFPGTHCDAGTKAACGRSAQSPGCARERGPAVRRPDWRRRPPAPCTPPAARRCGHSRRPCRPPPFPNAPGSGSPRDPSTAATCGAAPTRQRRHASCPPRPAPAPAIRRRSSIRVHSTSFLPRIPLSALPGEREARPQALHSEAGMPAAGCAPP